MVVVVAVVPVVPAVVVVVAVVAVCFNPPIRCLWLRLWLWR